MQQGNWELLWCSFVPVELHVACRPEAENCWSKGTCSELPNKSHGVLIPAYLLTALHLSVHFTLLINNGCVALPLGTYNSSIL